MYMYIVRHRKIKSRIKHGNNAIGFTSTFYLNVNLTAFLPAPCCSWGNISTY